MIALSVFPDAEDVSEKRGNNGKAERRTDKLGGAHSGFSTGLCFSSAAHQGQKPISIVERPPSWMMMP